MSSKEKVIKETRYNYNKDTEIVLTQWQTCVEMANSVSQRRDTMNNIFVTLNLATIAAISLICDIKTIGLSIMGVLLCVVWIFFIGNYKELNKEKFIIINQLEKSLPNSPFSDEWEALKCNKKYKDSTCIEKFIPAGFCIVYVAIIIISFATK